MIYSREEALKQVRRRETDIRQMRYHWEVPLLIGTTLMITVAFVVLMLLFHKELGSQIAMNRNYGTLLLNTGIGSYVLVAVISFTVGVIISVLSVRKRERHRAH